MVHAYLSERGGPSGQRDGRSPSTAIQLTLLHDLPHETGEPRAGLLLPLPPNPTSRRVALRIFSSVGAALAEKARLEGGG